MVKVRIDVMSNDSREAYAYYLSLTGLLVDEGWILSDENNVKEVYNPETNTTHYTKLFKEKILGGHIETISEAYH